LAINQRKYVERKDCHALIDADSQRIRMFTVMRYKSLRLTPTLIDIDPFDAQETGKT